MNVFYLKFGNRKVYLDPDIIAEEGRVTLKIEEKTNVEALKALFNNLSDLTIYTAIVQDELTDENGTPVEAVETDEIVYMYFGDITKLDKIIYNTVSEQYSVVLVEPDYLEERITEAEDAINFLLMGGME